MSNPDGTDQQFCWQQVLRVRPSFRLSHAYAAKEDSAGLLALYALFSALEEAVCRVSDETVARAKLMWWQQQLLSADYDASAHPITRQLYQSRVITKDAREHFRGLLATTIERLDAPAPPDENVFKSLCRSVGLHPMRLELAMPSGNDTRDTTFEGVCAVNGLVQLLRESCHSEMPAYTWLPLNLLARCNLTRVELQSKARSDKTLLLMDQVCALGLSWIENHGIDSDLAIDAKLQRCYRHWTIQTHLNVRHLKNLRRLSMQEHRREFLTVRAGDAWLAWRTARKISRADARK